MGNWLIVALGGLGLLVVTVLGLGLFAWHDRRLHRQASRHRSS